jgi:hypothetical protein
MNPDPAAVLVIVAASVSGAAILVALVVVVARFVAPWIEGWCARHDNRFISALAMSEDARLPWASKRRARQLFLSNLDDKQRRSWHLRRRFEVRAAGGRRYSISRYRPFNIRSGDALFCVQVSGELPVYDKLLAQKLLVEADEQLFLARSNVRTFSRRWEPLMAAARARYPLA